MKANGAKSCRRVARLVRRVWLVALLLLTGLLALALEVSADPSATWRGEYYNNVNLASTPALVRDDASIDFNWGAGSPGSGVSADQFSVRWTTFSYLPAGDYEFYVTTDDGARLWVDDQLIIDHWWDQAVTTFGAAKYLSPGNHSVRLEYYENHGDAVIKLWWSGGGAPITDWRGEYYNNTWLGGDPVLVRNDVAVSFDWGYGSPGTGVNADNFSARWTRDAYFATSASYVFSATVDDGVRVWVDGAIIIDKWYAQSRTTHTAVVYVTAGTHQVKVEYFEQTGVAVCILSWTAGTPTPQEIIVDDLYGRFEWGGPTSSRYGRNTGYRSHLYWTWNGSTQVHNWGKWYPHLPTAGNWEVFVYIASRYHGSKSAPYTIYHGGVSSNKVINQNIYSNQWVSLGTYGFAGGPSEYVYLDDATGEAYATRFVGFDAVKFVQRDAAPPSPTPVPPPGCSITPIMGFGRVWSTYSQVRAKLGCPTEVEKGVWAAEESFQLGYMFWRGDISYIYVLYSNGTWQRYIDTWTSAEPEWDPLVIVPPGYYQPKRGFGKVWRDNIPVRAGLGWATTEERGFYASVQQFEGGLMLWSNIHGIYVLYNDGTWARYD